jgi:hypothetical protein
MFYTDEVMIGLRNALRDTKGLKEEIRSLNSNIEVLERLASAIERQNELKEIELNIVSENKAKVFTNK